MHSCWRAMRALAELLIHCQRCQIGTLLSISWFNGALADAVLFITLLASTHHNHHEVSQRTVAQDE